MAKSGIGKYFNPAIRQVVRPLDEFIQLEQSSGIILLACSLISLSIANSPFSGEYLLLWDTPMTLIVGDFKLSKSAAHFINDGLMAIFFLLVGLEIKREVLEGQLSSFRKALLPMIAALGGMLVPAVLFTAFNGGSTFESGWGIPTATDIAFSLAVISLLGNRVPPALKVFLAALAIVDDLGAVIVIALFYTADIQLDYLYLAGLAFVVLLILSVAQVRWLAIYLLVGVFLWYYMLKSGVHATIAGVLLALTIPFKTEYNKKQLLLLIEERLAVVKENLQSTEVKPRDITEELEDITNETSSPSQVIENQLHGIVAFGIMPIFALCNTGVLLDTSVIGGIKEPLGLGIILGLCLGKPLGIFFFSWLAIKLKMAALPDHVSWLHLLGAGILAGIGFTMSIFITLLAFPNNMQVEDIAKLAIIVASVTSGVLGYLFLRFVPKPTHLENY
jgi:NhaA family Na+:H+ antiporter